MGARLIKDLSVFLAASLWAVMSFLQAPIILQGKSKFIYRSLEDFKQNFFSLSYELKGNAIKTLMYDNYFVLFFGLFLMGYIITLKSILATPKRTEKMNPITKKRLKLFLNIILIFSVVYMISDWTENWLLHKVMKRKEVGFQYFSGLQILKWALAIFILFSCLFVDRTYFKNNLNIISRLGLCLGIMVAIIGLLYFFDQYLCVI